ncbi:MAG TPA: FtsX-like permease family protein [Bacteroidia bacterium]|jgi:putative ABC transport system permease protein|nr:FtsX-like permease family protein [Bacteroidia bacterium]
MLFKVAWRNIWRNKIRSLVVIASVAVGLFAGMFMMAFFWGMAKQEIGSAVEIQLSHIQMHNPSFTDDKDVNFTLEKGPQVLDQLKKDLRIAGVSGRIISTGMISSSSTAFGTEIHGIVPSDEAQVSCISKNITEGNYFKDDKKNQIVIGKKLAEKLGVKLHSKIVLTFQSQNGDLTAGSFRISGIFRSSNSAFDQSTVFTNMNDLAPLLGTGADLHEIAILLKDPLMTETVTASLRKSYPSLLIQPWKELSPEMDMLTGLFDQLMYIIIGIILLALMFGIINTMLMAVLERQREFGVLMAIGMNKSRIFFMVMMESVLLTCVGLPVGILMALGTVAWLAKKGIDLSAFSQALSQYGFGNIIYPELQSSMFMPVIIMTAITAVLSAIYPAIKALQFKPAVAIHKL